MSEENVANVVSPEEEVKNNEDIRTQRLKKVDEMKAAGVNPYGHRVDGVVDSGAAKALYINDESETKVKVAGS